MFPGVENLFLLFRRKVVFPVQGLAFRVKGGETVASAVS
jgi:hypothetical protein